MKKILKLITSCFIIIILLIPGQSAFAFGSDKLNQTHRTGWIEASQKVKDRFNKKASPVKTIIPTKLALDRMNATRRIKGLSALPQNLSASSSGDIVTTNSSKSKQDYAKLLGSDPSGSLPAEVDNSTLKYFPQIGDQGALGSCSSFATTYYMATYETARARDLDASVRTTNVLSPKFTYNLSNDGTDAGSAVEVNVLTMATHGTSSWDAFPYDGMDYKSYPSDAEIWRSALSNRLSEFGTLESVDTTSGLTQMKEMLLNGRVLVFATYILGWDMGTTTDDPSTNADDLSAGQHVAIRMSSQTGGHSMTVVGYDDDIWTDIDRDGVVDPGEKGALKVANSWGTDWSNGNNGFIWVAYDALKTWSGHPSIFAGAEAFWVTAYPSPYVPQVTADITLTTARRNQLTLYTGINWPDTAAPAFDKDLYDACGYGYLFDYVFWEWGGDYSFAGTSNASTATLVIDLTDYIKEYGFDTAGGPLLLYVGVEDSAPDTNSQTTSGLVFKNLRTNEQIQCSDALPLSTDGSLHWFSVSDVLNPSLSPPAPDPVVQSLPYVTYNKPFLVSSEGFSDIKEWKFIPAVTGDYVFRSYNSALPVTANIMNDSRNLMFSDKCNNNDDFRIKEKFIAGKTYVLRAWHDVNCSAVNYTLWMGPAAAEKSSLATEDRLSNIQVSTGSLLPQFSPSKTSYSVFLPQETASVTVSATLMDNNGTLTINGSATNQVTVSPDMGETDTVTINSYAENPCNQMTYIVSVFRSNGPINDWRNKPEGTAMLATDPGVQITQITNYLGLNKDGTVLSKQYNTYGQSNTTPQNGFSGIIAVASGSSHSLGLKSDGTVIAIGDNTKGQCNVSDWRDIKTISADGSVSVGLKEDGTVVATGDNTYGQCNTTIANGFSNIVAISTTGTYSVGLKDDGTVVTTGSGPSATPTQGFTSIVSVTTVTLGGPCVLGIKSDGTVVVSGYYYGQTPSVLNGFTDIVAISGYGDYIVGLKSDGTLVTNESGRTFSGNGFVAIANKRTSAFTALKKDGTVLTLPGGSITSDDKLINIQKVASGTLLSKDGRILTTSGTASSKSGYVDFLQANGNTYALKDDGTLDKYIGTTLCTNDATSGAGFYNIVSIAGASSDIAGVRSDGTVIAIGINNYGECNTTPGNGFSNITSIAVSGSTIIGVRSDGTVTAIGYNNNGQCLVSGWIGIVSTAASPFHTVGLKSDGTCVATGLNSSGQCNVSTWTDIVALSAGSDYTLGLKRDGTIIAAGNANVCSKVSSAKGFINIIALDPGGTDYAVKSNGTIVLANSDLYWNDVPETNSTGDLIGLNIQPFTAQLIFNQNLQNYSIISPLGRLTVFPLLNDPSASIRIDGTEAKSKTITMNPGEQKRISIDVSSGSANKTYNIEVTRPISTDADLSSISTSAGTLAPVFDASITEYNVLIPNTTSSTIISATRASNQSTLRFDGAVTSSETVSLATGASKDVSIQVTAQDGSTTKTYTLHVTRAASSNANLSGITLSSGILSPVFTTNTTEYTATISYTTPSTTITATKADNAAAIMTNGVPGNSTTVALEVGETSDALIQVTAQDGITVKTYTVHVRRIPPGNAYLSAINVTAGSLTPAFDRNTFSYNLDLDENTGPVGISLVKDDSLATTKINGTPASSTNVNLSTGYSTNLTIQVTASDGVTVFTYTIHMTKAISTDASLASLSTSAGTLAPAFNASTTEYIVSIPNSASSTIISATKSNSYATLRFDGTVYSNKTVSLVGGETKDVVLQVTAQDGTTVKTYTVHATRAASSNADLSRINLTNGTLTPQFASNTLAYSVALSSTTPSTTLTPVKADTTATIKIDGAVATTKTVTLGTGESQDVAIEVTAQDGITVKTYTIHYYWTVSFNANLSGITLSNGTLSPTFSSSTTAYTVALANTVTGTTITPAKADSTATMLIDGSSVTSETVTVSPGQSKDVLIALTAQDGVTTKTYTVHITRAISSNANLSGIALTNGTLSPTFSSSTTAYTVALANTVTGTTVTPTKADSTATMLIDGSSVTNETVTLNPGQSKDVTITIIAQDGVTTKTYTVHITRAISSNANLSDIGLSNGTLSPSFAANITEYNATLANSTTGTVVSPVKADSSATLIMDGASVTSETVTLNPGQTKDVVIVLTAQDGVTVKTYTVHVKRIASNNADLSGIMLSSGILSPAFNPNTTVYSVALIYAIGGINIIPIKNDSTATMLIDGANVASKTLTLDSGQTKDLVIALTAQDGVTTKTYTIHVTRAASSNADLSSFTLTSGVLSPTFAANTTSYSVTLSNTISSTTITASKTDSTATLRIDGTVASSKTIYLNMGETKDVTLQVTAQDGVTVKTYTVHVSRAASSNADLFGINKTAGTLSPAFDTNITEYSLSLTSTTASVTLMPVKADNSAVMLIDSGLTVSKTVDLLAGESQDVLIKVTAQDGITVKTYTVHVVRAASSNASVSDITLSDGTLSPVFNSNTLEYGVTLPSTISSTTITPVKADSKAAMLIDDTSDASRTVNLQIGESKDVVIKVTAQDGITVKTYTVHVVRAVKTVTGVSLDKHNFITLVNGQKGTLTATLTPSDATNQNIIWSSSNTSIATVEDGTITAAGPGTADIIVTTQDGGYHDTCTVTVTPRQYSATATPNDISFGTVTGSGIYNEGAQVTLKAVPKAGYRFVRWTKGGTEVTTSAELIFTITSDITYTVEFAAIGIPANIKAVPSDYDSITVQWDPVSFAAGYDVWRSTSYNGTYEKVTTTSLTSFSYTGLITNTTYYYKVDAYCTSGSTTTYSSQSAYAYATPLLQVPSVATTPTGYDSVYVFWNAIPGASGYQVYRSLTESGAYTLISTTGSTCFTNTRLNTGTTYFYKVCAYRNTGSAKAAGNLSASSPATPYLDAVTGPSAGMASVTGVKVSWNAVNGRSGYEIWRSTSPDTGYALIKSTTGTYLNDSNLAPNITYYYKIRAYRTVRRIKVHSGFSGSASAMPVFNSVSGTTATMYDATSIKVTWGTVSGKKGYEVWRSTSPDSGYSLIKSTTGTTFTDKNLITNTTYYYKVRAFCTANGIKCYSGDSNKASATPILTAVTGVTASKYNSTKIKISWSSVQGKTGYEMWRSTSGNGDFALITSATSTSYYDMNVIAGTTYFYKIRAYRLINNVRIYGDFSTIISILF